MPPRAPRLIITRGLPASGKTTYARSLQPWVVRVNRDDLRRMLHGEPLLTDRAERAVTVASFTLVENLLGAGIDVCVDDTNLRQRLVRDWAWLAARHGATFSVQDFTDVPVDECVRRDATRPKDEQVGEAAIRSMWRRYLFGRPLPLPVPTVAEAPPLDRYSPPPAAPEVVLVDIDGTVALLGDRHHLDLHRVTEDQPNHAVIAAVRAMHAAGYGVIYCTGREESARADTEAWLAEHVAVPYITLHMRAYGDSRRDAVVKRDIFQREIAAEYRVVGVFDDRQHVVKMWRDLGLTVFQVAEGDF
ncbi:AAA family ATPase [Asanoa sp. WMMD1127]|uniref:phosphatase domain-containing protein n=1 Tax=Asanoa sp. WMMD1127 TaxID=3016107 RepID=UPI00241701E0|nr:AAA family ATPase [Asanoa sp. WMMD1127]MDG4823303.1 AAA family ATPase [Asanoa sp. WMMD1127]